MRIIFILAYLLIVKESYTQNDSLVLTLKVKLVKTQPYPPGCGIIAFALTQKFEIIECSLPFMKQGYSVLLNQACPEFLGKGYFGTNKIYTVKVTPNSGAPFSYLVINSYEKEKLPVFWIQEIRTVAN